MSQNHYFNSTKIWPDSFCFVHNLYSFPTFSQGARIWVIASNYIKLVEANFGGVTLD